MGQKTNNMKSPLRAFFLLAVICFGIALFFQVIGKLSGFALLRASGPLPDLSSNDVALPLYFYKIGYPDETVQELRNILPTLPVSETATARADLVKLFQLQEKPLGQVAFMLIRASWYWPPRFLIASLASLGIFLVFLFTRLFGRRPLFVVVPFIDRAGLNLGADLPAIILDRMRAISWQKTDLKATQKIIAENLDIPNIGLVSEGDSLDTLELLETALMLSTGIGNLPLEKSVHSLQIWMEQPRYLVHGSADRAEEHIQLNFQLIDRKNKKTEKVWNCELEFEQKRSSCVIDYILYPILFYFSRGLGTENWEALLALHTGLEEFQYFSNHEERKYHLTAAVNYINQALSLDPRYALAHYDLGLIHLATGEYDQAREHFAEALRLSKGTLLEYSATYNYGVAFFQHGQDWAYKHAVEVFQTLINSRQTPSDIVLLARSSRITALAKMAGRDPKHLKELTSQVLLEANSILDKTIPEDVKSDLFLAKGYAFLALKQFQDAQSSFEQAVKYNQNNITSLIGLGETYYRLDRREDALSTLQQAARLAPAEGYVHYRLGDLYRQMKETERAVELFRKAPNLPLARLVLGKILQEDGAFWEALGEFRAATTLNSHLSDAWENVAWTILELEQDDLLTEAEIAARRSVQTEKDQSRLWHRRTILSLCLSRQGKYELALKEARSAMLLKPEQAQANWALGYAQYQLGMLPAARESLQNVLILDKDGQWRTKAERLLITIDRADKERG